MILRPLLNAVAQWIRPDGRPTPELYQYMQSLHARINELEGRVKTLENP